MAKSGLPTLDPYQYRALMILPILYRTWSKLRLFHMREWVDRWIGDVTYAGGKGAGAADAVMATSVAVECAIERDLPLILTCVDLYKAFDQVNRCLCYALMAAAGAPAQIIGPYMRYLENVRIVPVYQNGVGREQQRKCAIPQGDPWS
eukprot:1503397-Alexandrium_andersonii.AAC.1